MFKRHSSCVRCGITQTICVFLYGAGLEIHHLNYDHLGAETPSDVLVLCRGCHECEEQFKVEAAGKLKQIFQGFPEKWFDCPYCGFSIVIGVPCSPRDGRTGRCSILPAIFIGRCCDRIKRIEGMNGLDEFITENWAYLRQETRR